MNWISVKDRLPTKKQEKHDFLVLFDGGHIERAWWSELSKTFKWGTCFNCFDDIKNATHWICFTDITKPKSGE